MSTREDLYALQEAAMLAKARVLLDIEDVVQWGDLCAPMNHDRDAATIERLVARGAMRFDEGEDRPRLVWVTLVNLRTSHEQTAWDRYYAALNSACNEGGAIWSSEEAASIADAMILERRKRAPHGTETLPIAEVVALRGLATQVKSCLAGEPRDLVTAYNRVEAARKKGVPHGS